MADPQALWRRNSKGFASTEVLKLPFPSKSAWMATIRGGALLSSTRTYPLSRVA
jgi:hypothetical protein